MVAPLHIPVLFVALALLSGCYDDPKPSPGEETPECMRYRAMMTAPLPPKESERLRISCEDSR